MSKDEALNEWLESENGFLAAFRRQPFGASQTEHMAREAWRAAVKHALSFVAGELRRRDQPGFGGDEVDHDFERGVLREVAALVARMEP